LIFARLFVYNRIHDDKGNQHEIDNRNFTSYLVCCNNLFTIVGMACVNEAMML
jgi:hypothetical protein